MTGRGIVDDLLDILVERLADAVAERLQPDHGGTELDADKLGAALAAELQPEPEAAAPQPKRPTVKDRAAAARAVQDAEKKTCEICGRVGTRRYVPIGKAGDGRWKCSPTATACAPQFRPPGTLVAPPKPRDEPSEMGVAFQRSEATKTASPPPSDIPAEDIPANVTPPSKPHPDGVTAHCHDCSRTWTLTGRVLDMAVEQHELKHSHIVGVYSQEATG